MIPVSFFCENCGDGNRLVLFRNGNCDKGNGKELEFTIWNANSVLNPHRQGLIKNLEKV